jgi:hypothetical protein
MSTQATVPILGPDGKVYDIPYENMHAALADGGKMGVYVKGPDQKQYVIPADKVNDAVKDGGQIIPYNLDASHQKEGFWGAAWNTLKNIPAGMVKSIATGAEMANPSQPPGTPNTLPQQAIESAQQGVAQRQADNRSVAYQAIAPVGEMVGADVQGMEKAANAGDPGGVLGHAAGSAVPALAPLAVEGAIKGVVRPATQAIGDAYVNRATSAVRATIPEASAMTPKASFGVEKIYRAAAPVGSDPMFRQNLYKAAGDLAEIGQAAEAKLESAKGGTIQPDMRVRATVESINDHLKQMYEQERAPQIARNAENPIANKFGKDATDALNRLTRNAGLDADRSLASKALNGDHLTLAETDQLAKLVNKELLGYESMTPAERAAQTQTNRRMAGLKSLDKELSQKIATELDSRGEPGIKDYEGRYAALSGVRDQLQSRMNAVELSRSIPGSRAIKGIMGGKSGIASASQAAVADVNIGQQLQSGFKALTESGIKAKRGVPTVATGPSSPLVRMNLLPETTGGPHTMQEAPLGSPVRNYTPPTAVEGNILEQEIRRQSFNRRKASGR